MRPWSQNNVIHYLYYISYICLCVCVCVCVCVSAHVCVYRNKKVYSMKILNIAIKKFFNIYFTILWCGHLYSSMNILILLIIYFTVFLNWYDLCVCICINLYHSVIYLWFHIFIISIIVTVLLVFSFVWNFCICYFFVFIFGVN